MNQLPPAVTEEKPAKNLASLVNNKALDELTESLIQQWNIRDAFHDVMDFGIRPIDKALFYGPPGNGKTMAAQAIAKNLGFPLYRVKCEALMNCYIGKTEANMAMIMDWISHQGEAVVLFDECEQIFPSRADIESNSAEVLVRSMQVFWQRLDRWDTPQLFLMATNLIDKIDNALISRIELKLEFLPPTKDQALKVVAYWAETLHEYGADKWGPELTKKIKGNQKFESFRDLWQQISNRVRDHIVGEFK